jgi:aspartyl-tRNA(Asn)/glutamyl-tRNA(Gln) amidotransferase subunit A
VTPLTELSASSLRQGYLSGAYSPVEVMKAVAARIDETRRFNTFITLVIEQALQRAREAESQYVHGDVDSTPLLGIPVAVKDNYDTGGIRTTYGSSMFARHVPAESASCVALVQAAGAIVVGKTSLHEFAWGISGVNPHFGTCHNPWDYGRIAGGSSSGSAAALALMQVPLALGSDTAGSIRIPAGFCGVVGLKPSQDVISRRGLFPLAPTLDHAGILARDPGDLHLLLPAVMGRASHPGSTQRAPAMTGAETFRGLRVGVVSPFPEIPLSEDLSGVYRSVQQTLVDLGAELVEIDASRPEDVMRAFSRIQQVEALEVHRARGLYPDRRLEYGEDVRRRLDRAGSVSQADYAAACRDRDGLRATVRSTFESVRLLLSPLGAGQPDVIVGDSETASAEALRDKVLPYTVLPSLAGIPSCAVRAGFDRRGLPVGVQFSGRWGDDGLVVSVAEAFHGRTQDVQNLWPDPSAAPSG